MTTPNMTCPEGGRFYACGDGSRYVGCCLSDPCAVGCPAGNLVKTEFDAEQYGQIPDQQCSNGLFYTCAYTDPPFWGCCSESGCGTDTGCPNSALAGAFLSQNPADAQAFLSLNTTWTQSTAAASNSSTNTGAIAGGVVGGVVILAALIFGAWWFRRRRNKRNAAKKTNEDGPTQAELSGQGVSELPPDQAGTGFKHVSQGYKTSPMVPSYHSSPQQNGSEWSPRPPSYQKWGEPLQQIAPQELPGSHAGVEMDSGQGVERRDKSASSTSPR
ncbi:hypothetical protein AC578_8236 [Pseudocercospora eumusae]|uniref:Uncharacterized protein n=1 Tax=Pseudocercospora eumusae TaxID=321146 RepID=A0A139HE67_9PEZI|nr:hypothetical protein AC578_8236 [Pseudocercospora eumusae]